MGPPMVEKAIFFFSDNTAVVAAVSKRRVRHEPLMVWVRELHFTEAMFSFEIRVEHIPGVENVLADHLSRNRVQSFREQFCQRFGRSPAAGPTPTVMPVPQTSL